MERPIIYQILVRLFGNKQKSRTAWGSISENGVGKMDDINDRALREIRGMGFNHVWYTGLIEHATCTPYPEQGIQSEHPSVVKGVAGSPYAIKDYYDIAPDLAENVKSRIGEFESLVKRSHKHGLKVIIDFVPNHLARQYRSDSKPEGVADFGADDDVSVSYSPGNNFYYVPGKKLEVPQTESNRLQISEPYQEFPARATGNDVFTHQPTINDWYETVKLNYGVDYLDGHKTHFTPIPDTWLKMRDILMFWSEKGVDGFRCDMAEMVPVEFWQWVIKELKGSFQEIIFIAEVYQPRLYKEYLSLGGFDYLYDKVELYDTLKGIIQGKASADQITRVWQAQGEITDQMLRFLENHDEQRIASPWFADGTLQGIPMMAATALMHKGPVMVYFGQEVGEPAAGSSGFSGNDGRTTIFDYWQVPEHQKWMNEGKFDGGQLSEAQKQLREKYIEILQVCNKNPLLKNGEFYDLQYFNRSDQFTGYTHRVFSFIRHNDNKGVLFVINFSPEEEQIHIKLPEDFTTKIGLRKKDQLMIDAQSFNLNEICDYKTPVSFNSKLPGWSYKQFEIRSSG